MLPTNQLVLFTLYKDFFLMKVVLIFVLLFQATESASSGPMGYRTPNSYALVTKNYGKIFLEMELHN